MIIEIGHIDSPMFLPLGSEVVSVSPLVVMLADYDYDPFSSPVRPAFDFISDKLYPDGSIERSVHCTSLPGRRIIEKKES